jgi:hypothetical protein
MNEQSRRIALTEGSRYIIHSIGRRDEMLVTEGMFLGYTRIGSDEALCIEVDEKKKKKLRIVPVHMILAMDIVSEAKVPSKKEGKKGDSPADIPISYFG